MTQTMAKAITIVHQSRRRKRGGIFAGGDAGGGVLRAGVLAGGAGAGFSLEFIIYDGYFHQIDTTCSHFV
jgi:hypothetical protein